MEHALELLWRHIAAHAANRVDPVVDAVAGDLGEQVHDEFAVAPRIHQERVEPDFVPGDAEPQEVAVDALELGNQRADVLRAPGSSSPAISSTAWTKAVECECEQMPHTRSTR